ncbi:unnamed protein product [Urochloa humidicola]
MVLQRRRDGDPPPDYGPYDKQFAVEVHHGGFFCGLAVNRTYMDEKVTWFDNADVDSWCYFWVDEIILNLGYGLAPSNLKVYWLLPGKDMSDGLRIISSDNDTLVMRACADRVKNFVLYFDHANHIGGIPIEDIVINPVAHLPKVLSPVKGQYVNKVADENLPDFCSNLERHEEPMAECNVDVSDEDYDVSYFADTDNDVEDGDDDLFLDNVDDDVTDQGISKLKAKKAAGSRMGKAAATIRQSNGLDVDDTDEEEELDLPEECDGADGVRLKFKTFVPEDLNNPSFAIGMCFSSVEMVRKAVTEYSLKHRVDIKMPRNDKTKVGAHCAAGCPWNLYASYDSRVKTFLVKRYVPEYNCRREWVLKRCTANWLADKYHETFRADDKMSLGNFARTVQKDWNLTPSRSKLCRARRLALNKIYDDEIDQYNQLWDYGNEIRRSNPGSTFYLRLSDGHFSSLYFALDACKRGFLSGCRPVICLDGCHIKTKFGGQILTAVGVDPNDCIFPIAMAVVEVESLVTWKWFLETLKEELNIDNTFPWTIMTDKQKGLIPAVKKSLPGS